jgi:hypothetical protein
MRQGSFSTRHRTPAVIVSFLFAATVGLFAGVPRVMAQADECLAELQKAPDEVVDDGTTLNCCDPYCTYSSGVCTFQLASCPNQANDTCTGADLKKLQGKTALFGPKKCGGVKGLKLSPGTGSTCSSFVSITAKAKRRGKATGQCSLKLKTKSSDRPPRKDLDSFTLVCDPNDATRAAACGGGGDGGNCDANFPAICPPNPDGGPNMIRQVVLATGTDLDNGFSGDSHNFPVIEGSQLQLCLSNCNNTDDPICDTCARTGQGTGNGITFGPPLPLVAGGVPVCVINRYKNTFLSGTANVATGEITGTIDLLSTVITTPPSRVCPRCTGGGNVIGGQGTCDGGLSNGQACTIEGLVRVNSDNPPISNALYPLSSQCLPGGLGTENAGTLDIGLPLTTGTATRTGRCPGQTQDDACGAAACGPSCSSAPPLKGGINQTCCANDPNRPCFPTKNGGTITRTGTPVAPQPPWDTDKETYPKSSTGENVVAIFCIPATTSSTVNQVAGLPGPGALILPVDQEWSRTP